MFTALVLAAALSAAADAPERSARLLSEPSVQQPTRPRLWPSLVLTAGGGLAVLSGAGLVWSAFVVAYWYAFSAAVGAVVMLTAGIVLIAVGIPLLIVGAVKLKRVRAERLEFDAREEAPLTVTLATF